MKTNEKKAVVIGATGIIGRAITQALTQDGKRDVVGFHIFGESVTGAQQVLAVDLPIKNNHNGNLLPCLK